VDIDPKKLKPAEGTLAVSFVDDEDDDAAPELMSYEGCLALVVAVGTDVKGVKAGDVVVCKPYARDGLKLGDVTLISSWDVAATIKE
jgi:hypothetical protein